MKKVLFGIVFGILILVSYSANADLSHEDFLRAVILGNEKKVQQAIEAGADVNAKDENGLTPLMAAASNNSNPLVIVELSNAGADANAQNKDGLTPLLLAAVNNSNPLAALEIIKAGAEVNAKDENGLTPLMAAAFKNSNSLIIVELINAGADVNAKNLKGKSVLDHAREGEHTRNVTVLIKAGAK